MMPMMRAGNKSQVMHSENRMVGMSVTNPLPTSTKNLRCVCVFVLPSQRCVTDLIDSKKQLDLPSSVSSAYLSSCCTQGHLKRT